MENYRNQRKSNMLKIILFADGRQVMSKIKFGHEKMSNTGLAYPFPG